RSSEVQLQGRIAARRADSFDYVIEWATGIEPEVSEFTELASGTGETAAIEGTLATLSLADLHLDNPAEQGAHHRYLLSFRVRVLANYGETQVPGEQRRAISIAPTDTLLDAFPVPLGVDNASDTLQGSSGEGSAKLANLDDDPELEIIYADADGVL